MARIGHGSPRLSENMRRGKLEDNTWLLRQIPRSWVKAGHVTSQAFRPTQKDKGRLSVYDGDRITPRDAWTHYTTGLGFQSVGVVAVTVAECVEKSLPVYEEPRANFQEHILIDFRKITTTMSVKRIARELRASANLRGWLFREPDDASRA